jgi:putative transposase
VKGRKRHLVVDTLGLILALLVLPAHQSDRAGAETLLGRLVGRYPRLSKLWADSAYQGLVAWAAALAGWTLVIVRKAAEQVGFAVQPHRWIVERTFAWLENYHRLGKEYERLSESSEALIYLAMIHLMVRRLARTL